MTTMYRGRCPRCGTLLHARPRRHIVDAFWEGFDRVFAAFDRLLGKLFKED